MVRYKTDENGQVYIPDAFENEMVLYSTDCPKCKILEAKLQNKGIYYTKNTSIYEMQSHGFTAVPVLSVDGNYLNFSEAVKWVNAQEV